MNTGRAVSLLITTKVLVALLLLGVRSNLQAQLVADGATLNQTVPTTLGSDLIVGTNAGNTVLNIIAPGAVTNINGKIGLNASSGNNIVTVTGAGAAWQGTTNLFVGDSGSGNGLMVSNSAAVIYTNVRVGNAAASSNNLTVVNGATLSASTDINVGFDASANTLLVVNGGIVTNQNSYVGRNAAASSNQIVVNGAGSTWTSGADIRVGNNGSYNALTITNGGTVNGAIGYLGLGTTSSSNLVVVSGAGSAWNCSSDLRNGNSGSFNTLLINNGGVANATIGYLGLNASSSSNLTVVSGADSTLTASSDVRVGNNGSFNTLLISNGGKVNTLIGYVGQASNAFNNVAIVAGANSAWNMTTSLRVGNNGPFSTLIVTNAGKVTTDGGFIGLNANSTNNLIRVDGGTLALTGNLDVRRGVLQLDSGSVGVSALLAQLASGTITFNGGTVTATNSTVNNGQLLTVGNGVASATYELAGNGLHTFANGATISSSATLKGNGTINGVVTVANGGKLIPGASVGKMVLSNSPVLQGVVIAEISKNGATLTNDQIQVIAPVTYGGSLVVSNLGPTALVAGDSFQLFNATSYGGTFTSVTLPTLSSGLSWTNKLLVDGSITVVGSSFKYSNSTVVGTNLVLSVSGGTPGGPWTQLTTTNVALPLSSWTTNKVGIFDGLGVATISNGINAGTPYRFFTVRMP